MATGENFEQVRMALDPFEQATERGLTFWTKPQGARFDPRP
jgi:hypothetical protein